MNKLMIYVRYLRYVLRHKWFVFLSGLQVGAPLWQLVVHDFSKFLPCELGPYARFFYGPKTEERRDKTGYYDAARVKGEFSYAWLHHQNVNPHHWQYWVLLKDDGSTRVLPMPERFIREMVADWMGAGRALGKPDTTAWYAVNRDKMQLHPETRARVEELLAEAGAR